MVVEDLHFFRIVLLLLLGSCYSGTRAGGTCPIRHCMVSPPVPIGVVDKIERQFHVLSVVIAQPLPARGRPRSAYNHRKWSLFAVSGGR